VNPQFPLYIVSKGRADSRLTSKALEKMSVPYFIIVEPAEFEIYAAVINPTKILVLDSTFQDNYDTCDDLGTTKSKGPGAARNFAWEHSIKSGAEFHWVMDDNIRTFYRWNRNRIIRAGDGTIFRCMEDFVLRYENVAMAGPNYEMFVLRKGSEPPFVCNTRIYSCNLIRNSLPYRWRGRYNEDTDLSLRMLKDGWCTIQFNAFLQKKLPTQTVSGGCNSDFYQVEGTMPKSRMQVNLHPDVSRIAFRFGRWHHYVDYRPFKKNKLIRKSDAHVPRGTNDYGLKLVNVSNGTHA
jgi:hypothetical protein